MKLEVDYWRKNRDLVTRLILRSKYTADPLSALSDNKQLFHDLLKLMYLRKAHIQTLISKPIDESNIQNLACSYNLFE